MAKVVGPHTQVGGDGGSFRECDVGSWGSVIATYNRYCTIRDNEYAPPTSVAGRKWVQIFRTPDDGSNF